MRAVGPKISGKDMEKMFGRKMVMFTRGFGRTDKEKDMVDSTSRMA